MYQCFLFSSFIWCTEVEKYKYQVHIRGNASEAIIKKFRKTSLLFRSNEVISITSLKNRYAKDKKLLRDILSSFGYFQGQVTYKILKKNRDYLLLIDLSLKAPFRVGKLKIKGTSLSDVEVKKLLELKEGDVFSGSVLTKGVEKVKTHLQNQGYPFVEVNKPFVCIDYKNEQVNVDLEIEENVQRVFGNPVLKGLKHIKPDFILSKLSWKKGDVYNEQLLESTKRRLIATGIIGYVSLRPVATQDKEVPIRIKVFETPLRTFSLEGIYSTSERWGGRLSWEHKNLHGKGESIGFRLQYSKVRSHFIIDNRIPHFFNISTLELVNKVFGIQEKTRAYSGSIFGLSTGIEKFLKDKFKVGIRTDFEYGNISKLESRGVIKNNQRELESKEINKYQLRILSFPKFLDISHFNDDLDPTSGYGLYLELTPNLILNKPQVWDLVNKPARAKDINKSFFTFNSSFSFLLPLKQNILKDSYFALFNKFSFGNIFAKDLVSIVPHKRFFLGGIRDMRAYGSKEIGDVDDSGNPRGGLSYGMYSSELRMKFNEEFGFNLYYELGFVSSHQLLKNKNKKLFHGLGGSFIYYTKIGPMQFGIAFPLRRRRDFKNRFVDSLFQFYVGIGQIT